MKPINYKSEETTVMELEKEITKAYIEVLNRLPDPMGSEVYLNSILKGYMIVPLIRSDLKSSPEYKGFVKKIELGEIPGDVAYLDKSKNIIWLKKINEEDAIKTVNKKWNKDGVTIVSTWNVRCGIANYTSYLMDAINKIEVAERGKDLVSVYAINAGMQWDKINANLVHIQHEFGIMPKIIHSDSKMIITFHSVTKDILKTMAELESRINIVGYIVHFDEAKEYIDNAKQKIEMESNKNKTNDELRREKERKLKNKEKKIDVFMVPHGSKKIVDIEKEKVRELLRFEDMGISKDSYVAFVFGFQSGNKNFNRLISACKNVGIKIIVSGSTHECGYRNDIDNEGKEGIVKGDVIFLDRYLDEVETDLYALASDILLFDYLPQEHFSCSGALHRVIGAGRPCVVSNTNHFLDVRDNGLDGVLKFNGQLDLEQKIREGLDRRDELGEKAREYAENTSWDKIAKEHLILYSRFTDTIQSNNESGKEGIK